MREVRRGTHRLYKGQYFLVFYDKSDENLMYMFDNVREILTYLNKPLTKTNINVVNVELYRALKGKTHLTRLINNQLLRVYIIDLKEP